MIKIAKYSTFCRFLLQQKVNDTHWIYKVFIGVKKIDSDIAI